MVEYDDRREASFITDFASLIKPYYLLHPCLDKSNVPKDPDFEVITRFTGVLGVPIPGKCELWYLIKYASALFLANLEDVSRLYLISSKVGGVLGMLEEVVYPAWTDGCSGIGNCFKLNGDVLGLKLIYWDEWDAFAKGLEVGKASASGAEYYSRKREREVLQTAENKRMMF